jgi:TRAP-type C4-dicarboxylate transport system permease small subunit
LRRRGELFLKKIEKILDSVMRFLMALAMAALVVGGTWQVVSRSILGNPSTFTDEFERYILIWAALIGSAYCFYRDEHLSLELVTDRAKGWFKVALEVLIEACVLFFVIYVFIYGGIRLVSTATNYSAVMRIPMKALYMVEPICGFMIIFARILKYADLIMSKKGEKN